MKTVLFVCTGNTCRSPMAEYYFNSETKKRGYSEITATSCGIYAVSGIPMSQNAIAILASLGIDAQGHRSRPLDAELMGEAHAVYGMTLHHAAKLKAQFPEYAHKIFCMPDDIDDPYGGKIPEYEECFRSLRKSVDIVIKSVVGEITH